MSLKTSVKLSMECIDFFKKFRTNRRKMDIDSEDLSYWKLMELIVKYFKNHQDYYLELVKLRYEKNV